MKKTNKKGFTLVELVIVIAVIAILAGVMIATFSNVVSKANASADLQEIKSMLDAQYYDFIADNSMPISIKTNAAGEFVGFSSTSCKKLPDGVAGNTLYDRIVTIQDAEGTETTVTKKVLYIYDNDEVLVQEIVADESDFEKTNNKWGVKATPAGTVSVTEYRQSATIKGKEGTTFNIYLITDASMLSFLEREKGATGLTESNIGYYYIEQAD